MSKNAVNISLMADASDLDFLCWGGVFPLHASWFYVVIKCWHLVLSQCMLEMCYVQYGSAVNIPVI
jgi:hypothetical protein